MNSEKIRQLTETLHQTVEALSECYGSGNSQQATHATCNTFGSTPNGGCGPNPMSFGWSPSRGVPYPVFNGAFPGGTYPPFGGAPTQGWSGGFSNPWWGVSGPMQSNGYAPVQPFGGTPAFNGWTLPFYGMNMPSNFAAGFYGSNVTNCVPGSGMPVFGYPSPFQGGFPTGTWVSTGPGSFPVYSANGAGFPFFGYGQPGFADAPCGPQNQPTGWTPNSGPTGVVDIPLAA
jgi:hypothetical protein